MDLIDALISSSFFVETFQESGGEGARRLE
jgi:hypothetical protein